MHPEMLTVCTFFDPPSVYDDGTSCVDLPPKLFSSNFIYHLCGQKYELYLNVLFGFLIYSEKDYLEECHQRCIKSTVASIPYGHSFKGHLPFRARQCDAVLSLRTLTLQRLSCLPDYCLGVCVLPVSSSGCL